MSASLTALSRTFSMPASDLQDCRGEKYNSDNGRQYERALRAVMGCEQYSKNGKTYLLLSPAVVVHITATPVPVILGLLENGQEIHPNHFFCFAQGSDYIGVDNYKWLCEPGTDVPVHLDDGELNTRNRFADQWKVNLWLDDLDATPQGLGLFLANPRGACLLNKTSRIFS